MFNSLGYLIQILIFGAYSSQKSVDHLNWFRLKIRQNKKQSDIPKLKRQI